MVEDLILKIIDNNGVNVTDSRDVAKMVGKQHCTLMRDIRSCIDDMKEKANSENTDLYSANSENTDLYSADYQDLFIESTYKDSQNKIQPCYLITQKGCEVLAHKMKGKKFTEFTVAYVNAFHDIKDALQEVETTVQTNGVLTEKEWNKIKKKSKYLTENIHNGKSTRDYIKNCDLMHLQDVIDEIYKIAKPCRGEIRYEILSNAIKALKDISAQYDYSDPKNTFIKTVANDGVIKLQSIHTEKLVRGNNNKDRQNNKLKNELDEAKNNALKKEKELMDIKEKYDPNGFWTTLNYHPFSVNYMYDNNQITSAYQRWIDNFPKEQLHSKEEYERRANIDFNKPIVIYIKYRNLAKFDLDNLSKSLIDYLFNRYFLVDDSIVKGKVEFIKEHCDSYADGKIKFTLRNMTDDEIARLDD